MLYLFDLDGTLISGYMDNPDRNFHAWQLLAGRQEMISRLVAEGHQIGIVTNQAGVAYGFVSEDDVKNKFRLVGAQLGFATIEICDGGERGAHWLTDCAAPITPRALPIYVCYDKAGPRRKPSGAMIGEAIRDEMIDYYNHETEEFEDVPTLFIGDRPEDAGAARDAGVRFAWAEEFFR